MIVLSYYNLMIGVLGQVDGIKRRVSSFWGQPD